MSHILKNEFLALEIELPKEGYAFPRFDQTGKILSLQYKGIQITGVEKPGVPEGKHGGRGLFNEFGIDSPLGFAESELGEWCHKIGVGLLQKDSAKYHFLNEYKTKPYNFTSSYTDGSLSIKCIAPLENGYGYELTKEIILLPSGFEIRYELKNTGQKTIETNEYCHNFLAINQNAIGADYAIRFPFNIKRLPDAENVNPEQKIVLGQDEITFTDTLSKEFFFEDLSGEEVVFAHWELRDLKNRISISETGNYETKRVNLWGNAHVICPELFIYINVAPGTTYRWRRTYSLQKF